MANRGKTASQLTVANTAAGTDFVIALVTHAGVANNALLSVKNLFGNTAVDHVIADGNFLVMKGSLTPANSHSNSVVGRVWADDGYLYHTAANGRIGRVAWDYNF